MDSNATIEALLNIARGSYHNKMYQNSISDYESLLKYITTVGNSVSEEQRGYYNGLYEQYYQEYQFVAKKYSELLASGAISSSQKPVVYDNPMNGESEEKPKEEKKEYHHHGNDFVNDVCRGFIDAGEVFQKNMRDIDKKYKLTGKSSEIAKKTLDKSLEYGKKSLDKSKELAKKTLDKSKEIYNKYGPKSSSESKEKSNCLEDMYKVNDAIAQSIKNATESVRIAIENSVQSINKAYDDSKSQRTPSPAPEEKEPATPLVLRMPPNPPYTVASPAEETKMNESQTSVPELASQFLPPQPPCVSTPISQPSVPVQPEYLPQTMCPPQPTYSPVTQPVYSPQPTVTQPVYPPQPTVTQPVYPPQPTVTQPNLPPQLVYCGNSLSTQYLPPTAVPEQKPSFC